MVTAGAPIDSFGVGTRVGVSADAPYLDSVYKLVEYDGRPVLKLSAEKSTEPGRKQVFRGEARGRDRASGRARAARHRTPARAGHAWRQASRTAAEPGDRAAAFEADLARLPEPARRIANPVPLGPVFSDALKRLTEETRAEALRRAGAQ